MAAEIYKMLRLVLQQTDVTSFQDYLSQLLERIPSLSLEFSQYFQREWSGRKEWWAYCYRKGMGINTNMMVEAFHRVFKYCYLKGKVNKRVDNCLVNLQKYTRDKTFERVIKLTKGKSTHRLKLIHDRHNKSKALTMDNIERVDDSKWRVNSTDGCNTYTVTKQEHACMDSTCQLKCTECTIPVCIHQYICTCPDSLIQSTICKHIHILQCFLSTQQTETDDDNEMEVDAHVLHQDFVNNEVQLVSSHLQQHKAQNDIASLRQAIKGKLLTLGEQLDSCHDKVALQQLDKQINAAQHLFSSLQKRTSLHKMKPTTIAPANKNIERQKRFHSTKKKTKTTKRVRFTKPTREDVSLLFPKTRDANGKLRK